MENARADLETKSCFNCNHWQLLMTSFYPWTTNAFKPIQYTIYIYNYHPFGLDYGYDPTPSNKWRKPHNANFQQMLNLFFEYETESQYRIWICTRLRHTTNEKGMHLSLHRMSGSSLKWSDLIYRLVHLHFNSFSFHFAPNRFVFYFNLFIYMFFFFALYFNVLFCIHFWNWTQIQLNIFISIQMKPWTTTQFWRRKKTPNLSTILSVSHRSELYLSSDGSMRIKKSQCKYFVHSLFFVRFFQFLGIIWV